MQNYALRETKLNLIELIKLKLRLKSDLHRRAQMRGAIVFRTLRMHHSIQQRGEKVQCGPGPTDEKFPIIFKVS